MVVGSVLGDWLGIRRISFPCTDSLPRKMVSVAKEVELISGQRVSSDVGFQGGCFVLV